MNMQEFGRAYARPATHDIRFSAPMLMTVLDQDTKWPNMGAIGAKLVELGARRVGQARVNNALDPNGVVKDTVYSVPSAEWGEFSARCIACTDWSSLVRSPRVPQLTVQQRLARIEALLRIGQ